MLSVWTTVLFVLVLIIAVALGLVVQELKMNADSRPEPEHHIVSLQDHYTKAHMDFDAIIEQDRRRGDMMSSTQFPVTGRYIIMLNNDVSDWHLSETIRIMEGANDNSNGRLVAKHFKPIRTVMKGFTATIGKRMLSIVSSVHYYSFSYYSF